MPRALEAKGVTERLNCEGETLVVNLHGAGVDYRAIAGWDENSNFISFSRINVLWPKWSMSI